MFDSRSDRSIRALAITLVGLMCFATSPAASAQNPFAENIRTTEPLSPTEAEAAFVLPPGFRIELVASEPDIYKPMNLAFDHRGRLWVSDSTEYPYPGPLDQPGRDSVKIMEDTDGDGRFDKVTTFADGLNIPIGLYPVPGGCIVYSIPNIWLLEDLDGDDHVDRRTVLYGPMGFERDTHGMNNSFTRGFDGWLYACHGFNNETRVAGRDGHEIQMQSGNTYRMRLDGERVEQYTWGQVNPFGMTIDELGNLFTADCHSKPVYQLIRGGYYPSFGKPHDGLGFVPPIMDHLHGSTAIAGVAIYADDRFPESYQGNLFSGNVMTSRVNRNRLDKHGATRQAIEQPDFVKTSDPWFRPVDVQLGPDGALYLADFYNRIIGHYEVPLDHPGRDRRRGRIWRITYEGTEETGATRPSNFASLADKSDAELLETLADNNLTARLLALNYLVDRSTAASRPATIDLAWSLFNESRHAHQRAALLWALVRLGADRDRIVSSGIEDESAEVRTHTMRILSELPNWSDQQESTAVAGFADDDGQVRLCAADAIAQHPAGRRSDLLLKRLGQISPQDVLLRQATRIAIKAELLQQPDWDAALTSTLNANQRAALSDIALAVPTAASASFVLDELQREGAAVVSDPGAKVRHVALHAPADRLSELATLVPTRFPDDTAFQVEMLTAVDRGLRERGDNPRQILGDWGRELAERLIETAVDSRGWLNAPLAGKTRDDNPWSVQLRPSADGQQAPFLGSLPAGEQATGQLRSSVFAAPTKLSFYLAGHDGYPDKPLQNQNVVRLIDAQSGEIIKQVNPPRNDTAQRVEWDLGPWKGKEVQLAIVDGDQGNAYAWLAIGRFEPPVIGVPPIGPRDRATQLQQAALITLALNLESTRPQLIAELLESTTEPATQRVIADALLAGQGEVHLGAVVPLLGSSAIDATWLQAYAEQLVERDAVKCRALLDKLLPSLAAGQQLQVAERLASSQAGARLLLSLIDDGKLSALTLRNEQIVQRCRANLNEADRRRMVAWLEQLPAANEAVAAVMQERRDWLASRSPLASEGAAVFQKHCAACHQIAGQGAVVGPQLDGIGNRGVERLLEDLLDPNRNVDVAFKTTLIQTSDGATLSGLLRKETDASVTLIDQQGKEILIDKETIEVQEPSRLSLMPETLVADLPPEQFAQLIAYLLSQKAEPQGE